MNKVYGNYSIKTVENLLKEYNRPNDPVKIRDKEDLHLSLDGYKIKKRSYRYQNLFVHGYSCCVCGRKGTHFLLHGEEKEAPVAHFDCYADDGVMLTKDHIIAKSKGGRDELSNFQPMCEKCNQEKGARDFNEFVQSRISNNQKVKGINC